MNEPQQGDLTTASAALSEMAPREELVTFANTLCAASALNGEDAVLRFFEKPWHWAREYAAWQLAGAPQEGDATFDDWALYALAGK